MPQKFMSHPCSFLSITAGYFTLEFPSLYETEDRGALLRIGIRDAVVFYTLDPDIWIITWKGSFMRLILFIE
jgi:hypothetical protein